MQFKIWLESELLYHAERNVGTVKDQSFPGIYYQPDLHIAQAYAGGVGKISRDEIVSVKRAVIQPMDKEYPFMVTAEHMNQEMKRLGIDYQFSEDEQEIWRFLDEGGKQLASLISAKYDSISYPDDMGYKNFITTVVLDPRIIKRRNV